MSKEDRQLLRTVGLTQTAVADLIGKTRQAVNKGITADRHYFDPTNLAKLASAVSEKHPDKQPALQGAIRDMFDSLAERLGAGGPSADVVAALADAERVWLIFPRFAASYAEQPEAYYVVFDAINRRTPSSAMESNWDELEIVVYCDKSRNLIGRNFHDPWYAQRQILLLECPVIDKMTPKIIVDPHKPDRSFCFGLVRRGFTALAPGEAAALIAAFWEHVADKIQEEAAPRKRPLSVSEGSVGALVELGVQKL
ncbi:MAG TPA: helix-turn-helix transcriptional regulator [Allosphingosinicella sp.]|jgi:hypothetical protein